MVKKADIPKHLIDTAFRLAEARGWAELSLADIAREAKLPLSKVYPLFHSKTALLDGFTRMIDAAVLAEGEAEYDAAEPARDRLFDVVMRRFDALRPYRDGFGRIAYDQARDPLALCCSLCSLRRSMALMLEAAGLSSSGPRGLLRVKGLSVLYLATMRVWLRDETADLSKTMAALDGYLRRFEGLATRLNRRGRGTADQAA